MTKTEQLAAIAGRFTRYEVTAEHPDGRRYLVGYTSRTSRPGLLAKMRDHGPAIIARLCITDTSAWAWRSQPRAHCIVEGWRVGFTGRTQRDAICAGEIPSLAAP